MAHRDADGPLATIRLRDGHPLDRTRVVRPSLEALRQVPQIDLQVLSIGRPGLSINARSRLAVQAVVRLAESVDVIDMVPERRQRLRAVPPRGLSYPVERTLPGTPALRPDPGVLARLPLGQLPSLHGLRRFGLVSTPHRRASLHLVRSLPRYYGAVRLPAPVHRGRALRVRRAGLVAMDQARGRASRVPHTMFPCMPGVSDPARSAAASP